MRKNKKVNCIHCHEEYMSIRAIDGYCNRECRKEDYRKKNKELQQEKYRNSDPKMVVICPVCNEYMTRIDVHLRKIHNIDSKTFGILYPGYPVLSESIFEKMSENIKGEKNPGYGHNGELSPFSRKFIGYVDKTEYEKETIISNFVSSSQKKSKENGNLAVTVDYYVKRGYDEKTSRRMLSERQRTFTLEKCIEKHGIENGTKIWQERQDKWLATLDIKSEEEKSEINRKKLVKCGSVSKKESMLASELKEIFVDLETQYIIRRTDDVKRFYSFDIRVGNKIIEFNGDLYHANPIFYSENDIPPFAGNKKTAKELWQKDTDKRIEAQKAGYLVKTIWEHDYNRNRDAIFSDCVAFLKSEECHVV